VAVAVGEAATAALRDLLHRLLRATPADAVRWTPPDQWHLTLHFLGDVPADRIANLERSLHTSLAGARAFPLRLEGLGAFPSPRAPRVLWVGLGGDLPGLLDVRQRVIQACAGCGEPPDPRPFHPHLTFGRVRRPDPQGLRAWHEARGDANPLPPCEWPVNRVTLYRSQLRPASAVHTELAAFPLA
jgi:2'-5' RNA ligase